MPTVSELGLRFKTKYPGAYDDLPDDELGRKVKAKYPGAYDDFTEGMTQDQAGAEISRLAVPKPVTPNPRPFQDPLGSPQLFNRSDSIPAPLTEQQKASIPPPIAPVRLPDELVHDPLEEQPQGAAPLFGAGATILNPIAGVNKLRRLAQSGGQILGGISRLAPNLKPAAPQEEYTPAWVRSPIGLPMPSPVGSRYTPELRESYDPATAASDIIRGNLNIGMEPEVIGPATIAAPLSTAAAIGTGIAAQHGTEGGLRKLGVPENWARLGGDVAGLAAGGYGAHAVSPIGLHPSLHGRMFSRPASPAPTIADTPAAATTTHPTALPPIPRPLGSDARMRQEVQLGPGAEVIPERLMGQTPLQRATRAQLGDSLAALLPSGLIGPQVEAMPSQLARLRPKTREMVPTPGLQPRGELPQAPAPVPEPPPAPRPPAPEPQGPAFTTDWGTGGQPMLAPPAPVMPKVNPRRARQRGSFSTKPLNPQEDLERSLTGGRVLPAGEEGRFQGTNLIPTILDTHERTGGSTYNLQSGDSLAGEKYFSVSPFKDLERVVPELTPEVLQEFVNSPGVAEKLNDPSGKFSLGTWFNSEDGMHYLDVVITTPNRMEALQIGAEHAQKAIFDLNTFEEIPVPEMQDLYHWSTKEGLSELDPNKWGTANAGQEMRRKLNYGPDFPDRTYYIDRPAPYETEQFGPGTRADKLYQTSVPKGRLYDFAKDPEGFKQKVRPPGDITMTEKAIKDAGYIGYRGTYPEQAGTSPYAIFEKLPAKRLTDGLDRMAQEAGERLKIGLTPQKAGERGSIPIKTDDNDIAIWGAAKMARGITGLKAWKKSMIEDFGPEIEPRLDKLAKRSQWNLNRYLTRVGKELLPNIRDLWNKYEQGKEGELWYENSTQAIRDAFGQDSDLFLRFVAASSPMMPVEGNLTLALKAYLDYKTTGTFSWGYTKALRGRLQKIVEGETNWENITPKGPKVQSFGSNLAGDLDKVTIDRWIGRAFGFGESFPSGQYSFMDYTITQLAKERGVPPAHLQAAIWKTMKEVAQTEGAAEWTPNDFGEAIRERIQIQDPEMARALSLVGKQPKASKGRLGSERGSFSLRPRPSTPGEQYAREMISRREAARTAGAPGLLGSIVKLLRDTKSKGVDSTSAIADTLARAKVDPKERLRMDYRIDRSYRAPSLAAQFMKDNGLLDVIRKVDNIDNLDQFLIAKQAQAVERIHPGSTGRDLARDAALLKEFGPRYQPIADQVKSYSDSLLKYMEDSGLVSSELAAKLRSIYPDYVPISRVFSEIEATDGAFGQGGVASVSTQDVVRRIQGSDREIENPLASFIDKTHHAFVKGERNLAARTLAETRNLPGMGQLIKEVPNWRDRLPKDHFSYFDNGEKRVFETTPEIAAAAGSLDYQTIGLLGKILSTPVRLFKLGTTGISLPFTAANVAADYVGTSIISKNLNSVANPKIFVRALLAAVKHDSLWSEMVREGSGFTSFDLVRDQPKRTIEDIRAGKDLKTRAIHTVSHPIRTVDELYRATEDIVSRSEQFGRARLYAAEKAKQQKSGTSPEDSRMFASQEANWSLPNYYRAGSWARPLNSVVPYLNANIQGIRSFTRAAKERPIATSAKLATLLYLPIAMTTAWNLADPERRKAYTDIDKYEKDNNFIILPPTPTKDDRNRYNVIKIKIPPDLASLSIPIRRAMEQAQGLDPVKFQEVAMALIGGVSPVGTGSKTASTLLPQAMKPTIQGLANYDFFREKPQVPTSMLKKPAHEQTFKYTSGTARKIGNALGISPIKTEEFIKGTLGGVGSQVLNLSDRALASIGAIPKDQIGGQPVIPSITARFSKAHGGNLDEQDFKRLSELSLSYEGDKSDVQHKAEAVVNKLKTIPERQRNSYLLGELESGSIDDDTADALDSLLTAEERNLTPVERYLLGQPAKVRARFMLEKLQAAKGPARQQLYDNWISKDLLTDAVADEINELLDAPQH